MNIKIKKMSILFLVMFLTYILSAQKIQNIKIIKKEDTLPASIEEPVANKQPIPPSPESYQLIWEDNFSRLDHSKWKAVQLGNNYNHELQYYLPDNVTVQDGRLLLTAKREACAGHSFTSGSVQTQDTFAFQYGILEVRAKHPAGTGLFPAIWLLPATYDRAISQSGLPEIDVMEVLGQQPRTVYSVLHWKEKGKQKRKYVQHHLSAPDVYHIYKLEWTPEFLRFYVDGVQTLEITEGIPHEPMFLIMNLAVGGSWPGSPSEHTAFPASLEVDYVRVYEKSVVLK